MVGGVLAGIAEYFGTDPTIIRVLYAVFGVLTGVWPAVVVYVIAMIVIPEAPKGGEPQQVGWPDAGQAPPPTPPSSSGWPHATGTETVQTPAAPPPAAPAPEPPAAPSDDAPASETP
jgi:phage shock protein C